MSRRPDREVCRMAASGRGSRWLYPRTRAVADRFRGRARSFGGDVSQMSDEALRFGNDALRKLTREVDHRPLLILAVAVGVGALAAGLLARRG
jgi:hypothetical protein